MMSSTGVRLLLIGLGMSCAEAPPDAQGIKLFDAHGVSFSYPDTWHATADSSAAPLIVEVELDGPGDAFCDIAVYGDTTAPSLLVRGVLDKFREDLSAGAEGELAPISRTLAGISAEGIVWTIGSSRGDRAVCILAANVNDRAVALYWQAFARDLGRGRSGLETIVASLRIEPLEGQ